MTLFTEEHPSIESYWRSIILFGANVASYKFALGRSLLDMAHQGKTFVTLEDLAGPFSMHIVRHLEISEKQGTSSSSKFLQTCREYRAEDIDRADLFKATVSLGFNNVIDAFHVVNRGELAVRFFEDQRSSSSKGIVLTDNLLRLKDSFQFSSFPNEVEARWRLVETAWNLGINRSSLEVNYAPNDQMLYSPSYRRSGITPCRDALNGYQKGKCFYCFSDISIDNTSPDIADVDHFFPHVLKQQVKSSLNLDGVWNLVLSCRTCNRGRNGKGARVPDLRYLYRLEKRNNFLIDSHHPLRETLIMQAGMTELDRRAFLMNADKRSVELLIHRWHAETEQDPCF